MNKTIRAITMAGMGIMAGLTVAGPAQAATSDAQSATAKPGHTTQVKNLHRDRDEVVGYYRSLRSCVTVGRIGERFNKWDDFDCNYVRFGFRRGSWALEVQRDRGGWNRPGHGHGRPWNNDDRDRGPRGPWNNNDRDHGPRGPWNNDGPRR